MKNYLSKQKIPFTMVANQIIFDPRISSKAKFYYVYLSSKPEGWEFHTNAIVKQIKEGKDAFYTGLNELEEFGYLVRIQKRIGGKFSATEYNLLMPNNTGYSSCTENPDTINSDTENQVTNNKDINNKDINKKDCIAKQNFSNKATEVDLKILTKENFAKVWKATFGTEPTEVQEDKFISCWNKMKPENKGKHNNDWEAYFYDDYSKREFYPNSKENPIKIAEQEKIEVEKRREEAEKESKKIAKHFEKNGGTYDKELTGYVKKAIKLIAGESVFANYFEDVYCIKNGREGILVSSKAFDIKYYHDLKVDAIFSENKLKGMFTKGEDKELAKELLEDLTKLDFRPTKWHYKTLEELTQV